MSENDECILIQVIVSSTELFEGKLLYDAIVEMAQENGLDGATVLRGVEGFGAGGHIHKKQPFRTSDDIPVVIMLVDKVDRIQQFLPVLNKMVKKGLVIQTGATVLVHRHSGD
jgi:PII-like signaling protein